MSALFHLDSKMSELKMLLECVDEYEDMVETVKEFNEVDLADLAAYISTLPAPKE